MAGLSRWFRGAGRRPTPAPSSAPIPKPPKPWNETRRAETIRAAARDGATVLERIRGEEDLKSFIDTDPCALSSTLHGQARFGWVQHLWRAGLFDGTEGDAKGDDAGYPLGTLGIGDGRGRVVAGIVRWPFDGHRLLVGATGSQKSTAGLLPLLLNDDGKNVLVIDPADGELALTSALYRAECLHGGRNTILLNPCGVANGPTDHLNPLDAIHGGSPSMIRDARKLVDALVLSSGQERDPFWVAKARDTLLAVIIHLATTRSVYQEGAKPTLMDAQMILALNMPDDLLEEMAGNKAGDGLVARAAAEISTLKTSAPATWHGIKVQLDASLGFLNDPGVRSTLSRTSFDVRALRTARLSIYVILPKKEMVGLARWLRLIYASLIDQVYDIAGGRDLHVVIDEFPALGKFERVETDLATLKKFGVQFHLAVQDLNQLHELYGHGWQTIVGNCAVRQFFGVNDNFTADYLSHALGQTTKADGFDLVRLHEDGPAAKRWRWVGAPLMSPADILSMRPESMILLTDRTRPFMMGKTPYFAALPWSRRGAMTVDDDADGLG